MSAARQIEERAALWVLHREESAWSSTDQAELDAWLSESDAHKAAFWRIEEGWRRADRIASLGSSQRSPKAFDELSWGRPLALAASLLLVFGFFWLQWPKAFMGTPDELPTRYETPVGGHEIVSLPDGSRIELNTDTAIKAVVNSQERAVWLERGEAFFEIAKRHGRKFVIYAGARTVTVLGTKFSVRRDPSEIVVAVLEGRVSVDATAADAPDRHATVTAGDVAIARGRSTLITNSADAVRQQLAWRSGRLMFHDATLATAVEQFNRYNYKQLTIEDPEVAAMLVEGTFQARNVDAFTRVLKDSYGLDVESRDGKIFLSPKRLADRGSLNQLRTPLSIPRPRVILEGSPCGSLGCPAVPTAPPFQPLEDAKAAQEKAAREAENWQVLYKLYPPRALAAREQGTVGFAVRIDARGNPASCKITRSSGHPLLDLETCELIMIHATFNRAPDASRSQQRSYEGVVNWALPATPPPAAPVVPKKIAEAPPSEPLICKTTPRTGSNAAFDRTCMTKSEWQHVSDEVRYDVDRLPQTGASCVGVPARCR